MRFWVLAGGRNVVPFDAKCVSRVTLPLHRPLRFASQAIIRALEWTLHSFCMFLLSHIDVFALIPFCILRVALRTGVLCRFQTSLWGTCILLNLLFAPVCDCTERTEQNQKLMIRYRVANNESVKWLVMRRCMHMLLQWLSWRGSLHGHCVHLRAAVPCGRFVGCLVQCGGLWIFLLLSFFVWVSLPTIWFNYCPTCNHHTRALLVASM